MFENLETYVINDAVCKLYDGAIILAQSFRIEKDTNDLFVATLLDENGNMTYMIHAFKFSDWAIELAILPMATVNANENVKRFTMFSKRKTLADVANEFYNVMRLNGLPQTL